MNTQPYLFTYSTIADGNMGLKFGDQTVVLRNRQTWLEQQAVDPGKFCLMECVHGTEIVVINQDNFRAGRHPVCDVLTTNHPDIALGLLVADCLPVLFFDPRNRAIALAHLNRHNIANNLVAKTITSMQTNYGSHAKDLQVTIGPSIKKNHIVSNFLSPTRPRRHFFLLLPPITTTSRLICWAHMLRNCEQLVLLPNIFACPLSTPLLRLSTFLTTDPNGRLSIQPAVLWLLLNYKPKG